MLLFPAGLTSWYAIKWSIWNVLYFYFWLYKIFIQINTPTNIYCTYVFGITFRVLIGNKFKYVARRWYLHPFHNGTILYNFSEAYPMVLQDSWRASVVLAVSESFPSTPGQPARRSCKVWEKTTFNSKHYPLILIRAIDSPTDRQKTERRMTEHRMTERRKTLQRRTERRMTERRIGHNIA